MKAKRSSPKKPSAQAEDVQTVNLTPRVTVADAVVEAERLLEEQRFLMAVVLFIDEHTRRLGEPPKRQIFLHDRWKNVDPEILRPLRLELILRAGAAGRKREDLLQRFVHDSEKPR